jgi:predicted transcriptional regulator
MSRKVSIRLPHEVYLTLDRVAESHSMSLSAVVVKFVQQALVGQRPFLESDTANQFNLFCQRAGLNANAAIRRLLSRAQESM